MQNAITSLGREVAESISLQVVYAGLAGGGIVVLLKCLLAIA